MRAPHEHVLLWRGLDFVRDAEAAMTHDLFMRPVVVAKDRFACTGRRTSGHDPGIAGTLSNCRDARSATAVIQLDERAFFALGRAHNHGVRARARGGKYQLARIDANAAVSWAVALDQRCAERSALLSRCQRSHLR